MLFMITFLYKSEELAENWCIIFMRNLFVIKRCKSAVLDRTLQYVTAPCSFVYPRYNDEIIFMRKYVNTFESSPAICITLVYWWKYNNFLSKCVWWLAVTHSERICKCLRSPGIDSEESIPPAYVAWRAGTTNRVSYGTGPPGWESIPGLFKRFTNTGSGYTIPGSWWAVNLRVIRGEGRENRRRVGCMAGREQNPLVAWEPYGWVSGGTN